ncbi:pks3, partial [Symbiodinium necroappetens]
MGCSSSMSVMHDDVEDTLVTRVNHLQDATGQEYVQQSAPFKEGLRRFNSMRISDRDASGIN